MKKKTAIFSRYSVKEIRDALDLFSREFWFAPSDVFLRVTEALIWSGQRLVSPVLDIGCGDGRISRFLFANQEVIDVGLDADPKEVSNAELTGVYKDLVIADAAEMPFKRKSFRTVVSNSTFEHIKDDIRAIDEVSRVLVKSGRFLFTVPTERFKKVLLGIIKDRGRFKKFNARLSHFRYRSLSEWQEILEHSGFRLECWDYYLPKELVMVWYNLFRLATFNPYRRELWSYMKDSPYGKLVPRKLVSFLISNYLFRFYDQMFSKNGTWVFIIAKKRK